MLLIFVYVDFFALKDVRFFWFFFTCMHWWHIAFSNFRDIVFSNFTFKYQNGLGVHRSAIVWYIFCFLLALVNIVIHMGQNQCLLYVSNNRHVPEKSRMFMGKVCVNYGVLGVDLKMRHVQCFFLLRRLSSIEISLSILSY